MENSDTWVQFWENPDYEKGTLKFDEPIDVPNMDDYELNNPNGLDKGLDDQVDSLKTGPSGWLELYQGKNYTGNVLRVYPGSNLPNLDDYNMGDNTNSFRLFNQRPISWPASDINAPGECWVRFYGAPRFSSNNPTRINGPGSTDTFSLWGGTNAPWSLTTGPSTWVKLYPKQNLDGSPISLGPNSLIQNFNSGFAMSTLESLEIFDAQPKGWKPSVPNSENVETLLSLESQGSSASMESLIAGIAGSVPEVGSALRGLVGALWPNQEEPMEVWDSIELYIDALLSSLIDQDKADYLKNTLNGLYRSLVAYNHTDYGTDQKGSLFSALLTELRGDAPYFIDQEDPSSTLTFMIPMGTIMLLVLREQALFYEDIYGDPDPSPEMHQRSVVEHIDNFTRLANQGASEAMSWRIDQIDVVAEGSSYYVVDSPANYKSPSYSGRDRADDALAWRRAYVANEYRIQLDALLGPVRLWKYLAPDNTLIPTQETHEVQSLLLSNNNPSDTAFSDDPHGEPVTGLIVRSGDLIDSIQMIYGGEPGPVHGSPSSGESHRWDLEENESIVGVFGGAGGAINQLVFRTNLGREIGTGGSGGNYFIALAPQGVNAALIRIDGYQSEAALEAIRFTWSYQRYV